MQIGVIGLGNVGLTLAATLAACGNEVQVWDPDRDVREAVAVGEGTVIEPDLAALLSDHALAVDDLDQIAASTHLIFLALPAPMQADGTYGTAALTDVLRVIGPHTRLNTTVAVTSTLSPGSCRECLLPIAAQHKLSLAYTPLLARPGTALADITNAQIRIIGGPGQVVAPVLLDVMPRAATLAMNYESAELAVLSLSAFTALRMAWANDVGRIAHRIGADIDDVLSTIAMQSRRPLVAGAGFGTGIGNDLLAFRETGSWFADMIRALNFDHALWIRQQIPKGAKTFGLLGQAPTEGPADFADLIEHQVTASGLRRVAARQADVVVLVAPIKSWNLCEHVRTDATVIDLFRTHTYLAHCGEINYIPFGCNS